MREETDSLRMLAEKILANHQILESLSDDDVRQIMSDCCEIIYGDYFIDLKCDFADILYRLAFRDDMSLERCWQIYWNLNHAVFVTPGLKFRNGSLDELYRHIFEFIKSMTNNSSRPFIPADKRNKEKVVIITSQFLGLQHAPTRRVLDYSYALQHDLNKQVIIINDAGMHYYMHDELDIGFIPHFMDTYNENSFVEYKGERFTFLQNSILMPDLTILDQLANTIYSINPAFVYNIGGSSLSADLCDDFTTVVSLPCAYSLAISCCSNLLLGRTLEGDAKEQVRGACSDIDINMLPDGRAPILPYQHVVETKYNFVYADMGEKYTREQFGLNENDFVACVVGNRLDAEISEDFMRAVTTAIYTDQSCGSDKNGKNIKLVLVGNIEEQERIEAMIPDDLRDVCKNSIVFTGALFGAGSFIRQTDVQLNPERLGGGRAAFEGFWFGVPSVTLRKGDVYWAGVNEFGVDSWDEYTDRILKLKSDSSFYSEMSKLARKRAEDISDITATQRRLLDDLGFLE